jgi:magnesium chelatase family protein
VLAIARTFALIGIEAEQVHVELDVNRGLPAFAIVGLPDAGVRESRERVRSALVNAGFSFPLQRITANLAPADLRKAGPGFDLAIAAALLTASGQLSGRMLERYTFAGELALDGSIRPVPGVLAMAERTRSWGMRGIAVSERDVPVAGLVDGIEVIRLDHVSQLRDLADESLAAASPVSLSLNGSRPAGEEDLSDLRGQAVLRKAIEVAAAGAHGLLMVGPPGAGKTLAARRLPSLLPPLERDEALEVLRVASAFGSPGVDGIGPQRPFRAPHHTVSARALIGGGTPPGPGEVTRAHRGVLFLDELGEYRRDALEALREPLESGEVTISRGGRTVTLPCRFQLVAASNPCPCGRGPESGECECHVTAVARYRAKLSGALADRIEVFTGIGRPGGDEMADEPGEPSAPIRDRVAAARERQGARLGSRRTNAEMTPAEIRRHCKLTAEADSALRAGHEQLGLSGRGWDAAIRVAQTLADLHDEAEISGERMEQSLGLRRKHAT